MTELFDCPNCLASLTYDSSKPSLTVKCEYCGSTVIVPESLRGQSKGTVTESEQAKEMAQVAQLVRDGQKIAAIKLVRETFGVGLKEAKDMVEALEHHEVIHLGQATFELPDKGSAGESATDSSSSRGKVIGCVLAIVVVTAAIGFIGPILGGGMAFFGIFSADQAIDAVEREARPDFTPTAAITHTPEISPTPGFASEIMRFGGQEGTGPGFFNDTRWIGMDGEGRIYTGDYQGGRVQAFDASGNFVDMWHGNGEVPLIALAVDRDGVVYLLQSSEIQRYDGLTGEPLGPLQYPVQNLFDQIGIAPDGSVVAVNDDGLVRFDRQGNVTLDAVDVLRQLPDYPFIVEDIDADGAGNIYVTGQDTIYRFDPEGNFVDRIGSRGEGEDQFGRSPDALAIDGQGRLFVKSDDIMVFDENGRYLDTIDSVGVAFSLVFNDQNQLVVMARNDNQVIVYELNR